MTPELESRLKQMFAELDEDLPSTDFTSKVTSELLKPRRRERLLRSSAILAALPLLWLSFSELEAGLRIVAGLPQVLFDIARGPLSALSQSPLLYIYGTALGGYLLLRLARLLELRLM